MADRNGRVAIKDARAGRNAVDPPQALSATQCAEALNVDWFNSPLGRKRGGVAAVSLTSSPFTGTVSSLFRHVPASDETAAEMWGSDDASPPAIGRLTGGTAWATPTLKDAPTGNGFDFTYASLSGKLFIAYKTAVDRLHVWDPIANSVRRTGLAVMAVPTVADNGSGTYAANIRYYRTRATEQQTGITVRRSEPSAIATFTPSGSGVAARVTLASAPGEGETHWEVEGSTDGITFYRIATVVIGTTTYDDSAVINSYIASPLSALTGTYTLQKSYRFIAADQGRILGFGAFTSTNPQSRIEFSAVLGSSDIGDAERVPLGNYYGLDEKDSGTATALVGPVNGSFFAGKFFQFWKLTPTGDPTNPYGTLPISKVIGVVGHEAIKVGEDEAGRPALYWMSHRGPYRYGIYGQEYLGKTVEDKTIGSSGGVSLNLSAAKVISHVQWFADKRQVWCWMATGSSDDPDTVLCFSVGQQGIGIGGGTMSAPSGWSVYTGGVATARCSVLFATTIAASMSRTLKPYIGSTSAVNTLGKCDTGTQDLGANYQAYVTTRALVPWQEGHYGSVQRCQLIAGASAGVTITVTVLADFGLQSVSDSCLLTAAGSETRVQPTLGGAAVQGDIRLVQFRIGDASALNSTWSLDELLVTFTQAGPIAA